MTFIIIVWLGNTPLQEDVYIFKKVSPESIKNMYLQ